MKLKVDRRALIPRPETEHMVELVEKNLVVAPASILDLGTGTGAIALALAAKYPSAQVMAVDQSADALALAAENTGILGFGERVKLLLSDWFSAVPAGRKFQLIVSNPPYLTETEVAEAQPEVKDHEPKAALTPGGDGTAALRQILTEAPRYLEAGGMLACETGIAQHKQLLEAALTAGFTQTKSLPDLTGRERYLLAFI